MSLTDLIYAGSNAVAGLTEGAVKEAIEKYGEGHPVLYPDTAYCLPIIYAATGVKIKTLGDLPAAVGILKSLITNKEDLGEALNAGLATAVGAEIIEALRYLDGDPYAQDSGIGFVPDPIIRSLGVPLVTGDIPGIAVLLGEASDPKELAAIVKDYQEKGLLTFMVGNIIEQAAGAGVKMGLDYRVIPLGHEVTSVIHVVSVAIRAALIFGGIEPGKLPEFLAYTKERVPAFVNTFGPIDEVVVSVGAGAIALGFPVIADVEVPEVPGALLTQADHAKTVETSLETRGIKIKVTKIDVPVSVSSAFEGERVRKDTMFAEFGGNKTAAWELVTTGDLATIEDHKITVVGPDIDDAMFDGVDVVRLPLGVLVEVAGKEMQSDFETVLERRIHYFMNYIEGAMHVGQRNTAWIRLTKEAFEKGFRLKHIGEVLYAKMRADFDTVVDKCQVTIYTKKEDVDKIYEERVKPIYAQRDDRMSALTDESVDEFYTCLLCQSFAPSHVCIVTPERLGLCGAVSWLDAKATKQLDPTGPNQPVVKGQAVDERLGIWTSVNEAVATNSQGAVEKVTLYSILEDPMTSCGCFECICGIMPEANGVIIVNREFPDASPVGMTFGELASMTGGGVQTPGFMGHGRQLIGSKKFMSAEGGLERIVWMPKELKDDVAERLNKAVKEMTGIENFADMVCDETIAIDSEAVLAFLEEKGHPALAMDPIM
ncbi:CO dehydrogenase/CO-methylating acetyl-CoA synthase complex subunit beta [Acetobacterium fimetarium]|uniref:CO-methylating acetyl-CoA synthase n=1 Tax=Acetobacterium fimetarium TaxID=52691 RepID=A0ABR6WSC4_9FIRM|nr:acetyl-CoA decarbonylase/synthase complex subunit alpha/beta [Acetobacterium fimetarium]MBC3803447.1 CO dehydrogenase/CO-methylating acetyl-CoA synthase complex subunit beta [Acetobacterium fimetarium]